VKPGEAPLSIPAGAGVVVAHALRGGALAPAHECVPQEVAVALEYNGVSHAVMLATPADLEDFALGFSLTEGLIDAAADLLEFDSSERDNGIVLSLRISARCEARLKHRRRNLAGRTGCGLCGTDSLDQVRQTQPLPAVVRSPVPRVRELAAPGVAAATGATHVAWARSTAAC
jgi:FdhD protein